MYMSSLFLAHFKVPYASHEDSCFNVSKWAMKHFVSLWQSAGRNKSIRSSIHYFSHLQQTAATSTPHYQPPDSPRTQNQQNILSIRHYAIPAPYSVTPRRHISSLPNPLLSHRSHLPLHQPQRQPRSSLARPQRQLPHLLHTTQPQQHDNYPQQPARSRAQCASFSPPPRRLVRAQHHLPRQRRARNMPCGRPAFWNITASKESDCSRGVTLEVDHGIVVFRFVARARFRV